MSISYRLLCVVLGTSLAACGGGNLTLPNDGAPAALKVVSGDGQEGTVGSRLPDPLVVRLTDGAARPIPKVALVFSFQGTTLGGKIDPATVETDDAGFASVRVRLGSTTGPQTIEARMAQNAVPGVMATFGVTATPKRGGGGGAGGGGNGD